MWQAATASEVAGNDGAYVRNCAIANEVRAHHAGSPDDGTRLWQLTATLLGRDLPS